MKQRLGIGLVLLALAPFVTGCAPNESGPSFGNLGRNFADDWTGARSFDSASANLARGNIKAVEAAGRALDTRIKSGSRASFNVAVAWISARLPEAAQNDFVAQNVSAGLERDLARLESNRQYRGALAFLPSDQSKWRSLDPQTLNALGYFLADRGRNRADFERAEKLTALAMELSPSNSSIERYSRAVGPGDSHAWALFRLGRIKEAFKAQAEVISTMGTSQVAEESRIPADIAYHWGAICRVAGREDAARDAFQYALTQNPSPEVREILEANLSGSVV